MTPYELYMSGAGNRLGASDWNSLRDMAANQWNNAAASYNQQHMADHLALLRGDSSVNALTGTSYGEMPFSAYLGTGMGGGRAGASDPMARMAAMAKLQESQASMAEAPWQLRKLKNDVNLQGYEPLLKQQEFTKNNMDNRSGHLKALEEIAKGIDPHMPWVNLFQTSGIPGHENEVYTGDYEKPDPLDPTKTVKVPGRWLGRPNAVIDLARQHALAAGFEPMDNEYQQKQAMAQRLRAEKAQEIAGNPAFQNSLALARGAAVPGNPMALLAAMRTLPTGTPSAPASVPAPTPQSPSAAEYPGLAAREYLEKSLPANMALRLFGGAASPIVSPLMHVGDLMKGVSAPASGTGPGPVLSHLDSALNSAGNGMRWLGDAAWQFLTRSRSHPYQDYQRQSQSDDYSDAFYGGPY